MRHVVPWALLATACGSEVTFVEPGQSVPVGDATLELVEGPIAFDGVLDAARVVARAGGFDLVSGGDAIVAQRIEIGAEPPFVRMNASQTLVQESEDLQIATVRGDELALCTRPWDGLSTLRHFRGIYESTGLVSIGAWNDFSCNGLAWRGGRGVVSWRLCPADGGLCYAVVQELDESGLPTSEPSRALGDEELWVAGVSPYGAGVAWAGGMGGPLQVWFSPAPGQATRVDVANAAPGDLTPRLARWPYRDDAVAVGWDEARVAVVGADGATLADRALVDPSTHRTTRPALASNDAALVTAHAECPNDAEEGFLVVTLWDQDVVRIPTACPTEASSVAVVDEHVLVVWPDRATEGYQGALLRIVR